MTANDNEQDYLSHFRPCFEENFMDGRHRSIGDLRAKYNHIHWSPAHSKIWYSLSIQEFSALLEKHCAHTDRQTARDDFFQEYAPLHYSNDFQPENFTGQHLQQLRNLNARLINIEQQVMSEMLPQVLQLESRVKNPDDNLQDYECDCDFIFTIGKDDPDYNEYSENVIIKLNENLKLYQHDGKLNHCLHNGENHNEFQHIENHPMQNDFHCWLFHCLYDHTHIGWVNILRIQEVWIDIHTRQQRQKISLEYSQGVNDVARS